MHKIIHINDSPDCCSGSGSGYVENNSHKRLSSASTRNGNSRENGQFNGLCNNESDSGDTDITQNNRSQTRTRSNRKKPQWQKVVAIGIAMAVPIIFPAIHMYIFNKLWGHMKNPVDTRQCSCSCWDTVFKGPYESGIAGFKHVYFNSDGNTLKMWIITVLGVLFLYEAFKQFFSLMFCKKLRWTMAILFLSSLHSHYYAWWGHWNYWNDDFYNMWYHQVFFTVTEFISSITVLSYLDARRTIEPIPMLIVFSIAVFHTFCSGWDQFVFTVVQGQGQVHQVLRDIILMTTDIMHSILSFYEIKAYAGRKGVSLLSVLIYRTHIATTLLVTLAMYVAVLMFP